MKITNKGNFYSFYFNTMSEIVAYNKWIDQIGIENARVFIPPGISSRQLRRVMTKNPAILQAKDAEAEAALRARWIVEDS